MDQYRIQEKEFLIRYRVMGVMYFTYRFDSPEFFLQAGRNVLKDFLTAAPT